MSNAIRMWISFITAVLVLLIVILTMPNYPLEPKVMFLPSGQVKPAYYGPVALYETRSAPAQYETLGTINLRYHAAKFDSTTELEVFTKLREMAAAVGGNGLVFDLSRTGLTSPGAMQVFMATAKVISTR